MDSGALTCKLSFANPVLSASSGRHEELLVDLPAHLSLNAERSVSGLLATLDSKE
jgi:hypothetical protein